MVRQGSIIKISFDPVKGSEQAGYRPAVVISNDFVISKTNIISICPITRKQGKSALNVMLDSRTETRGVVLCAHSRSVDIFRRKHEVIEVLPKDKLDEVLDTVISLIAPS